MTLMELVDYIWEIENLDSKVYGRNISTDAQAFPFDSEKIKNEMYKPAYKLKNVVPNSRIEELSSLLYPDHFVNRKVRNELFLKYGYKYCVKCGTLHKVSNFSKNKGRYDGLNSNCKTCQKTDTAKTQAARQIKYKSAKIQRTPGWSELELITEFYKQCPKGCHVDHIIPLQGKIVCGLHVLENLQYLPARENESKNNKFEGITIIH